MLVHDIFLNEIVDLSTELTSLVLPIPRQKMKPVVRIQPTHPTKRGLTDIARHGRAPLILLNYCLALRAFAHQVIIRRFDPLLELVILLALPFLTMVRLPAQNTHPVIADRALDEALLPMFLPMLAQIYDTVAIRLRAKHKVLSIQCDDLRILKAPVLFEHFRLDDFLDFFGRRLGFAPVERTAQIVVLVLLHDHGMERFFEAVEAEHVAVFAAFQFVYFASIR